MASNRSLRNSLALDPVNHLADLGLVDGDQVAGDAADHLCDPLLPLMIPVGHLHLATRQADHRRRMGARRGGKRGRAEGGHPRLSGQLACQVDPGRLPAISRVPGVADEYADAGGRSFGHPGFLQEIGHAGEIRGAGAGPGEVVEGGEGVGLAAAELGDQGQDRGRVSVRPDRRRSTMPVCSFRARVKQVREKNWAGSL